MSPVIVSGFPSRAGSGSQSILTLAAVVSVINRKTEVSAMLGTRYTDVRVTEKPMLLDCSNAAPSIVIIAFVVISSVCVIYTEPNL